MSIVLNCKFSYCLLLMLLFAAFCVAAPHKFSSSVSPASDASEYDTQSLLWEHELVFHDTIEWARSTGLLTSTQSALLEKELETRLAAFTVNKGSDVEARRRIYSFISARLSVPNLLSGLGLIALFLTTMAAIIYFSNAPTLVLVSIVAMGVWWWIGAGIWRTEQWQVLGGSLLIIPIILTASAAYGLLILIGVPDSPAEFLFSEISTILCGCFVFYVFEFSFLLAPVFIAGWLLWTDIWCLFRSSARFDPSFFHASWIYGLILLITGSFVEGPNHYTAFWMYFVGGFTFIGGLLPLIMTESCQLLNEIVFLTSSAAMIYACTSIQRAILLVYGAIGITIYVIKSVVTLKTTCNVSNPAIYFRALFSVLFFSLSVIRYDPHVKLLGYTSLLSYGGFAEYGCGIWLLVLHTLSWPLHIYKLQNSRYRSLSLSAHLATSIGIIGLSRFMKHMTFDILTLIVGYDCGTIVSFIAGIGLISNHCSALLLDIGIGISRQMRSNIFSAPSINSTGARLNNLPSSQTASSSNKSSISESMLSQKGIKNHNIDPNWPHGRKFAPWSTSRIMIIILTGLLSAAIPTKTFARSSVISLVFFMWSEFIYKSPNQKRKVQIIVPQWLVASAAFILAKSFDLGLLEYVCLGCIAFITRLSILHNRRAFAGFLIGIALMSVFLNSKLLHFTTAGFICLFFLMINKEYRSKKGKAIKLLSAVALVVSILISIGFFWDYDEYQTGVLSELHQLVSTQTYHLISPYLKILTDDDYSVLHELVKVLAWPLPLSSALIAEGDLVLSILILIAVITAFTAIGTLVYQTYFLEAPLDESIPPKMNIREMTVSFPQDTNQNGIVIGLKGDKIKDFHMDNATLYLLGTFWDHLPEMYGKEAIDFFQQNHYPFKLFPNRMSKKHFHNVDDEQIWLHFGTGLLKEPNFSQSNIRSTLRKLVNYGDPEITLRVVYNSKHSTPKKAVLFEFDLRPSLILNSIREELQLKPIINDW